MALIKCSPGQKWPGFSFALHLLKVQGFYFALLQYSRIQVFTACFVSPMQFIPPAQQNSAQGFTRAFPAICRVLPLLLYIYIYAYPTIPHHLRYAGAYHSAAAPPARTRYQRHARALYRSAQPPYYNNVYKGAEVPACYRSMPDGAAHRRPCQPGGGLDASHAQRLAIWHRSAVRAHRLTPSTRWGSPATGARRAARNY